MKSLTIHGLDEVLEKLIREKAESEGLSLNKTIKKILCEALGVKPTPSGSHWKDFEEFSGIWSSKKRDEFLSATGDFDEIDPADWK